MCGPGAYVPDPTEGIVNVQDLPAPQLVPYSRNPKPPPAHAVTLSPLATPLGRVRCTPLARSTPVARVPSW